LIINSEKKYRTINNTMERIRKMRAKKKMEVKSLISNKIMDIVKKLENSIQNKPISMVDKGKSKEILMVDDGFFNLINNRNISKIKKNQKKLYFLIIK
jgi:hypothetical protein